MPICEDELIARLKRGESIPNVRKWFLTALADANPSYGELSPFEQSFLNLTVYAYEACRAEQLRKESER